MFDIAAEFTAYQALLEGHRAYPDDEELYADMLKAKAAMEIAWLQHKKTAAPRASHTFTHPHPRHPPRPAA